MAMFDDPKKELQKLEKQLLKEEEWFDEELEFAKALIGEEPATKKKSAQRPMDQTRVYRTVNDSQVRNYANGYGKQPAVKNMSDYDIDLDDYGDEVDEPKEKGVKGLVILACLETLGIVGVVAYWLLFLL